MSSTMMLAIIAVIVAFAFVGHEIWKWGPGLRKRSVMCPEDKLFADVLADQHEGDFACLEVRDVKTCSLFGDKPLNCDKECLTHL